MDFPARLAAVDLALQRNGFTLAAYIEASLRNVISTPSQKSLIENATHICTIFHAELPKVITPWIINVAAMLFEHEIKLLTQTQSGLHFNASHCLSEFTEGDFMYDLIQKIKKRSPEMWKFVRQLLRATQPANFGELIDGENEEEALGRLQGLTDHHDHDVGTNLNDPEANDRPTHLSRLRARNVALLNVKSVVIISIILQSANQKCNYLQSVLGIFLHSANAPEKVVETLSHAGLSISISSIHRAIHSLSEEAEDKVRASLQTLMTSLAYDNFDKKFKAPEPTILHQSTFVSATSATAIPLYGIANPEVLRRSKEIWGKDSRNPSPDAQPVIFDSNDLSDLHERCTIFNQTEDSPPCLFLRNCAWHIRDILVRQSPLFKHFIPNLGKPETVYKIPLHKTMQIPCRAMKVKESTNDGNIEVIETLLRRGGLGEPDDNWFQDGKDVDITEFLIFLHGDLLTKERIDSVRDSRRIETTPRRRFQFAEPFLPGLFHFDMACVNAFWRTWIQPMGARRDKNSLFEHIKIARAGETGKFGSNPDYHQMQDVIFHDLWAAMLDCWRIEAQNQNPAWKTLADFAQASPSWEMIVHISHIIAEKYIAVGPNISNMRRNPACERDEVFENQTLRNRDEFLYVEVNYAIRQGDVGRLEELIVPWIYIFKATGKHKYALHMTMFLKRLYGLYPEDLRMLIKNNWLVNPTGKPNGFRGVDWLVERNNLFTKVIYGGSGSNCTIERIIEESNLIELFRICHAIIENGFYLTHRTIRHSPPDMTKTLQRLADNYQKAQAHSFIDNRKSKCVINDKIMEAMGEYDIRKSGFQGVEEQGEETAVVEQEEIDSEFVLTAEDLVVFQ